MDDELSDRTANRKMAPGQADRQETVSWRDDRSTNSTSESVDQSVLPEVFGDYRLIERIAHGGMGAVYLARQVSLDRLVAIKVILGGHRASEQERQRFHVEAQAAATVLRVFGTFPATSRTNPLTTRLHTRRRQKVLSPLSGTSCRRV